MSPTSHQDVVSRVYLSIRPYYALTSMPSRASSSALAFSATVPGGC